MEAFIANASHQTGFSKTILITSSATATFYPVDGPDIKIGVRTAGVYYSWGKAANTPITASGVAATQADWLPQNFVGRIGKPVDCDGMWILQDTGAAQIFITPGRGI